MAASQVFRAVIAAVDEASPALQAIRQGVNRASQATRHLQHEMLATEHQASSFAHVGRHAKELGEKVTGLRERFAGLTEGVGESRKRLMELIPALGGLAALGSVGGLFELTEKVSEQRSEFKKAAGDLGMTTAELGRLNLAAKLADVPIEAMQANMFKLEKNIASAARGKNKELAAAAAHIGLSLRQANGEIVRATDILPKLSEAFANTTDDTMRAAMGNLFFGKGVSDIMNFLRQGKENMQEALEASTVTVGSRARQPDRSTARSFSLGYKFSAEDDKNVEEYHKNMILLQSAVTGVQNAIGAKLAPVLSPILNQFKEWLVINREWIATGLKQVIIDISDNLKRVDWEKWGDDLKYAFGLVRWAVDELGGFRIVIEALVGLRFGAWLFGLMEKFRSLGQLANNAASAMRGVSAAAAETSAAQGAGATAGAGGIGAAVATVARLALPAAAGAYVLLNPTAAGAHEDSELAERFPNRSGRTRTGEGLRDTGIGLSRTVYGRNLLPQVRPTPGPVSSLPRIVVPQSEVDHWFRDQQQRRDRSFQPFDLPSAGFDPLDQVLLRPLTSRPETAVAPRPQDTGSETKVTVRLEGFPPGTRVDTESTGRARTHVEVGRNWPDGMLDPDR